MAPAKSHLCAYVEQPGKNARIEFHNVPTPRPAPGNVLVRMKASGVWYATMRLSLDLLKRPVDISLQSFGLSLYLWHHANELSHRRT